MGLFRQIHTFVQVAHKGSLTAVAKQENIAPAMIGRRIDALEERLGVKLLVRSTRKISLTHEGAAYLENCQRILHELQDAENAITQRNAQASGLLRISAPAGFGRQHIAPHIPKFLRQHSQLSISLDLSDRIVDLVNEGFDCAIRIGVLPDSNLISVKLADNRRLVVAAPAYLKKYGTPKIPQDLLQHECLNFGTTGNQQRVWQFRINQENVPIKVSGVLECSDGSVLREWALASMGLAWRSLWEVGDDLQSGRLQAVLTDYEIAPLPINAVFPQRRHLPLRVRLFVDRLKSLYAQPRYWHASDPAHKSLRR